MTDHTYTMNVCLIIKKKNKSINPCYLTGEYDQKIDDIFLSSIHVKTQK